MNRHLVAALVVLSASSSLAQVTAGAAGLVYDRELLSPVFGVEFVNTPAQGARYFHLPPSGLVDMAIPPLDGHEALEAQARGWAVRAAAEWARKQNAKERASLMAHLLIAADVESVAENADWTELLGRCQKTLGRDQGNALDVLFRKAPKRHQERFIASMQQRARARVERLVARLQSGEPMTSFSADDRALLERIAAAVETMDNEAEVSRRRPGNRARQR